MRKLLCSVAIVLGGFAPAMAAQNGHMQTWVDSKGGCRKVWDQLVFAPSMSNEFMGLTYKEWTDELIREYSSLIDRCFNEVNNFLPGTTNDLLKRDVVEYRTQTLVNGFIEPQRQSERRQAAQDEARRRMAEQEAKRDLERAEQARKDQAAQDEARRRVAEEETRRDAERAEQARKDLASRQAEMQRLRETVNERSRRDRELAAELSRQADEEAKALAELKQEAEQARKARASAEEKLAAVRREREALEAQRQAALSPALPPPSPPQQAEERRVAEAHASAGRANDDAGRLASLPPPAAENLAASPSESAEGCSPTMGHYQRLRPGMTYSQAKSIIGCDGTELNQNQIGGIRTTMYKWGGSIMSGSMQVIFQNNRITAKTQFGLE